MNPRPTPNCSAHSDALSAVCPRCFGDCPRRWSFARKPPRPTGSNRWASFPALAGTGLLLYGLWQMSDFQKQERPWRNALDRAKLLGLVNFGLCPFLYWQNKMPEQPFFNAAVFVLVLSALLFLFNLNVVLKQLGAMLPDETLRHETLLFTALNRWLLVGLLFLGVAYVVFLHSAQWQLALGNFSDWLNRLGFWALTLFRAAAPGHDHGAHLENQGSHPRQRLRREVNEKHRTPNIQHSNIEWSPTK